MKHHDCIHELRRRCPLGFFECRKKFCSTSILTSRREISRIGMRCHPLIPNWRRTLCFKLLQHSAHHQHSMRKWSSFDTCILGGFVVDPTCANSVMKTVCIFETHTNQCKHLDLRYDPITSFRDPQVHKLLGHFDFERTSAIARWVIDNSSGSSYSWLPSTIGESQQWFIHGSCLEEPGSKRSDHANRESAKKFQILLCKWISASLPNDETKNCSAFEM